MALRALRCRAPSIVTAVEKDLGRTRLLGTMFRGARTATWLWLEPWGRPRPSPLAVHSARDSTPLELALIRCITVQGVAHRDIALLLSTLTVFRRVEIAMGTILLCGIVGRATFESTAVSSARADGVPPAWARPRRPLVRPRGGGCVWILPLLPFHAQRPPTRSAAGLIALAAPLTSSVAEVWTAARAE